MARKSIETQIGIGLLNAAGLRPNAPQADAPKRVEPVHAQAAVLAAMEGHSLVWEKGFKVGRGLEPAAARPYAESTNGKRPSDLLPMSKDEERDFNAGFVAGYRSRFAGEDLGNPS